jgi:hypothetical protein
MAKEPPEILEPADAMVLEYLHYYEFKTALGGFIADCKQKSRVIPPVPDPSAKRVEYRVKNKGEILK